MLGKKKCPECGTVQDSVWKYCQTCGVEMPRPIEERTIPESGQLSWLNIALFALGLIITVGFGVYGFMLFNLVDPKTKAQIGMTSGMGIILMLMTGVSLFFMVRGAIRYWRARRLR